MDFGNAALLIFTFVGLVAEAKALVWGDAKQRITVGLVNAVGLLAVFLVAETAWGTEQFIGGQQLGLLDWASKVLVGLILGGGASGLWEGFTALKNIGQNQMTKVQAEALDAGAARLVAAQYRADQGGSHSHDGEPAKPEPVPFTGVWPSDAPTT